MLKIQSCFRNQTSMLTQDPNYLKKTIKMCTFKDGKHVFNYGVKFVEDHLMNIHVQFGFNHICSFRVEGI